MLGYELATTGDALAAIIEPGWGPVTWDRGQGVRVIVESPSAWPWYVVLWRERMFGVRACSRDWDRPCGRSRGWNCEFSSVC